jgi:hypothetical protein
MLQRRRAGKTLGRDANDSVARSVDLEHSPQHRRIAAEDPPPVAPVEDNDVLPARWPILLRPEESTERGTHA